MASVTALGLNAAESDALRKNIAQPPTVVTASYVARIDR